MKLLTTTILAILALSLSAVAGTIGISNGRLIVGTEAGDGNQTFAPTISGQNPEPSQLMLMGTGLATVASQLRRRLKK